MSRKGAVERAFELAGDGRFQRIEQIASALVREDYEYVELHLADAAIRRQLLALCASAPRRAPSKLRSGEQELPQ